MPDDDSPNRLPSRKAAGSSTRKPKNREDESAVGGATKKKKKRFKRIRGAFNVLRKGKKKGGKRDVPGKLHDESMNNGVQLEDLSLAASDGGFENGGSRWAGASGNEESNPAYSMTGLEHSPTDFQEVQLKVILLLMDPKTRRFELLQLEFDSDKALVSDVLAQIPVSVTDDGLRAQKYGAVCDRAGIELINTSRLAQFCKGNDVLVAIPEKVAAKDCAQLARPILCNEKVIEMLRSTGIDTKAWKEDQGNGNRGLTSEKEAASDRKNTAKSTTKSRRGSGLKCFIFLLLFGGLGFALQIIHKYTSSPIAPGQVVSPDVWLAKCGLLTLFPVCENAFVHMSSDGILTQYNAEYQPVWTMSGGVCQSEECINGLEFTRDERLVIGGKPVATITWIGDSIDLSPWPFAANPRFEEECSSGEDL